MTNEDAWGAGTLCKAYVKKDGAGFFIPVTGTAFETAEEFEVPPFVCERTSQWSFDVGFFVVRQDALAEGLTDVTRFRDKFIADGEGEEAAMF